MQKNSISDLAVFGGPPLFNDPKSTSSLVQPDIDTFLSYSKRFFDAEHYTNNGPNCRLLEERLAKLHDVPYCIAYCSGFWAIVQCVKVLALKGKSEIILPSLTYRRMADIASWVGLKPRFCEVDEESLALTPETVLPCINDETALIMAVHPIVNCCDVPGLSKLAKEAGIPLVFDGVESVYESIPEGKIGSFGAAECFSMHASKLLNGFEGGYVTTKDARLAKRLRAIRTFGFTGPDDATAEDGLNAKLCEIHTAMALANLDRLEQTVSENRENYRCYQKDIRNVSGLRLIEFNENEQTSFKNIVVEVPQDWPVSRDELVQVLNSERVLARAYYAPALHQKPMAYPHIPGVLPATDRLAERFISMPCGAFVKPQDIQMILELLNFISQNGSKIKGQLSLESIQ